MAVRGSSHCNHLQVDPPSGVQHSAGHCRGLARSHCCCLPHTHWWVTGCHFLLRITMIPYNSVATCLSLPAMCISGVYSHATPLMKRCSAVHRVSLPASHDVSCTASLLYRCTACTAGMYGPGSEVQLVNDAGDGTNTNAITFSASSVQVGTQRFLFSAARLLQIERLLRTCFGHALFSCLPTALVPLRTTPGLVRLRHDNPHQPRLPPET